MADKISLYFVQERRAPHEEGQPPPDWVVSMPPRNVYPLVSEEAARLLIEQMRQHQQTLMEMKGVIQIGRVTHYRVVKVESPFEAVGEEVKA